MLMLYSQSCRTDFLSNTDNDITENYRKSYLVSLKDLPQKDELVREISNINLQKLKQTINRNSSFKNISDSLTIEMDSIKVMETKIYKSYTFSVKSNSDKRYNISLNTQNDKDYNIKLIEYNFSKKDWLAIYTKSDISNIKNKIKFYNIEEKSNQNNKVIYGYDSSSGTCWNLYIEDETQAYGVGTNTINGEIYTGNYEGSGSSGSFYLEITNCVGGGGTNGNNGSSVPGESSASSSGTSYNPGSGDSTNYWDENFINMLTNDASLLTKYMSLSSDVQTYLYSGFNSFQNQSFFNFSVNFFFENPDITIQQFEDWFIDGNGTINLTFTNSVNVNNSTSMTMQQFKDFLILNSNITPPYTQIKVGNTTQITYDHPSVIGGIIFYLNHDLINNKYISSSVNSAHYGLMVTWSWSQNNSYVSTQNNLQNTFIVNGNLNHNFFIEGIGTIYSSHETFIFKTNTSNAYCDYMESN
jgi:hypothetical protein